MNESPARAVWRFLRREGSVYVYVVPFEFSDEWPPCFRRVPVERFWGGAR